MVSPWPGLCAAADEAAPASLALTTLAEDGHHRRFPEDLHKSSHSVLQRQRIQGIQIHFRELCQLQEISNGLSKYNPISSLLNS